MPKIIIDEPQPDNIISVEDIGSQDIKPIVGYVSTSGSFMLLVRLNLNYYGFKELYDLTGSQLNYMDSSGQGCIKQAIKSKHTIFYFEGISDLINYLKESGY